MKIKDNQPSYLPLYAQVKQLITKGLVAGEWSPGEVIPSEMELAARYNVSQGTVRKAIDELAAENILIRRQGKGTYVASHTSEGAKYRFMRLFNRNGEREYPYHELLDFGHGQADEALAEALSIRPDDQVIYLKRLLRLADVPVVLDRIWVPTAYFGDLSAARIEEHINRYRGTLYGLYETTYGMRIINGEEKLVATEASVGDAALLLITPGAAVLDIERVTYTYGGQPVEMRRSICVTRNHYYYSELS